MKTRRQQAEETRRSAADLAASRIHPSHRNNGEEYLYRKPVGTKDKKQSQPPDLPTHLANFTKGLPHDYETGLLANPRDYQLFVLGIQSGDSTDFEKTPLGPGSSQANSGCASIPEITCESDDEARADIWKSDIAKGEGGKKGAKVRAWESSGAGHTFDLEGPDSQAVTMPPAPVIGTPELTAEMAEVYWMALLRDEPFTDIAKLKAGRPEDAYKHLSGLPWLDRSALDDDDLSGEERSRRVARLDPATGKLAKSRFLRGQLVGDDIGPYVSQFLLIGNDSLDKVKCDSLGEAKCTFGPDHGHIAYGAQRIDQRVRIATRNKDYMTTWDEWFDVQQGADVRKLETYECTEAPKDKTGDPSYRFITTPRDLATYVHHDALYQAYLNACILLLSMSAPFDRGIPFWGPDVEDRQQGFAHFGGPHILTLVCEVATRALKAVRYQKFNVHRRLRPEALAGRLEAVNRGHENHLGSGREAVKKLKDELGKDFLDLIKEHNKPSGNSNSHGTLLLPMAYPEGSPMHPSYGAGHGTVAGACITVLKAFFDHGHQLRHKSGKPICYVPNKQGSTLETARGETAVLTIEGELNKLVSNISIGRNWAGVHYYSDYIESVRLGERIAIGFLEEQKLTYRENFTMTVPLFEGGAVRI